MKFKVYIPRNETQLLKFLSAKNADAEIIAGGTNLVPSLRKGEVSFRWLADISHLSPLRYVRRREDEVHIGALTRIRDLNCSTLTNAGYVSFAELATNFGGPAIANMATVGGNLAAASPTSDLLPILLSLNAEVVLKSYRKKRTMKVEDFLLGNMQTTRNPEEVIAEVNFRIPKGRKISLFHKIGERSSMFLAVISVATFVSCDSKKTVSQVGVALNELSPSTPGRARNVEGYLKEKILDDGVIDEAVDRLKLDSPHSPRSDVSTEYWKLASRNLLRDQLRYCKTELSR
jgi:CO/xanthine dehydrogenase FAD-binding subunit